MPRLSIDRVSDREFVVAGELDGSTTDQFDTTLAVAGEADGPVVVDVSGLTFLDSSGVRSLIRLGMAWGPDGLVLRDPPARLIRILEVRGLQRASLWTVEWTAESRDA
jgi:anti-anti-sigma factor